MFPIMIVIITFGRLKIIGNSIKNISLNINFNISYSLLSNKNKYANDTPNIIETIPVILCNEC